MATYRDQLPQLGDDLFLTDGGIETTLIYHDGLDLPEFASFVLLDTADGEEALRRYFAAYLDVARELGVGIVLESATWRANPDWAEKLGYSPEALAAANARAVELLDDMRSAADTGAPVVISGCIGPRRDGYLADDLMTEDEAEHYHGTQISSLRDAGADLVTAITMTNLAEAIGITRAAQAAGMPVVISFTVETDGRLPIGVSLHEAIEAVDAATGGGPAYYMINCAHPTHFEDVLDADAPWAPRLRGLRANASRMSHDELDVAEELDDGDPAELGQQYAALRQQLPGLSVLGGCCGTDHRHIEAIGRACVTG